MCYTVASIIGKCVLYYLVHIYYVIDINFIRNVFLFLGILFSIGQQMKNSHLQFVLFDYSSLSSKLIKLNEIKIHAACRMWDNLSRTRALLL